jgi:hypothetical protein
MEETTMPTIAKSLNINLGFNISTVKGNSGDNYNVTFQNPDDATTNAARAILQTAIAALTELQDDDEDE